MMLPEPSMYKDWKDWAKALQQILGAIDLFQQTVYFQPCKTAALPEPVVGGMVYVIDTGLYMKSDGATWAAV